MSIRARALGACCLWAAAAPRPPPPSPAPRRRPRGRAGADRARASRQHADRRSTARLDEAVYAGTPAIGGFVQQEPTSSSRPPRRPRPGSSSTTATSTSRRAAGRAQPERRVANEMRRDTNQLRQNDTFAVLFDTFHDKRNGYLFYANAIGGFADSQITDEGPPNADWNTVWDGAHRATSTAAGRSRWPSRSSRCATRPGASRPGASTSGASCAGRTSGRTWRRCRARSPRSAACSRSRRRARSSGLRGARRQPQPRDQAVRARQRQRPTTPSRRPSAATATARVGGDVKYGITQNLTADLTVNTDFAQVEVDEQQVNLTRFNLFFPEKRDFFLEGAGTFAFAGRASAGPGRRQRRHAVPVLQPPHRPRRRARGAAAGGRARDRQGRQVHGRRAQRPDRRRRAAVNVESANFTVLRAKRDILRRSSVGGMFTHRTATPGRVGRQRRLRRRRSFGFYQNVRVRRLPRRARRPRAATATT